jgi:hypothetical protein
MITGAEAEVISAGRWDEDEQAGPWRMAILAAGESTTYGVQIVRPRHRNGAYRVVIARHDGTPVRRVPPVIRLAHDRIVRS